MEYSIGFKHAPEGKIFYASVPPYGTVMTVNEFEGPWSIMQKIDIELAKIDALKRHIEANSGELAAFFESLEGAKEAEVSFNGEDFVSAKTIGVDGKEVELPKDVYGYAAFSRRR